MVVEVSLWDIVEWKVLENPHYRMSVNKDAVTVNHIQVLDNIIWYCTGVTLDDVENTCNVAHMVKLLSDLELPENHHKQQQYRRIKCFVCNDGGDVIHENYNHVCRHCGTVCDENYTVDVNAFRDFDVNKSKSHHAPLQDQRNFEESCNDMNAEVPKRRKALLRNIIVTVCSSLELSEKVRAEALMDCELYLKKHTKTQLQAKENRLAKRIAAAALVKAMLNIFRQEYEMDVYTSSIRRRLYNNMDIVYKAPPTKSIN